MPKLDAISEKIVGDLPAPAAGNVRYYASGLSLQGEKAPSGFGVRVTSAGTKSFIWFHRVGGKGYLETIGTWDRNPGGGDFTTREAIVEAKKRAKLVAKGVDAKGQDVDPRPERTRRLEDSDKPEGLTVGGMIDLFVDRYVKKKLRSADIIESAFKRLVKPDIGDYGIYEIRRSHVTAMLDDIADENGPVMADRTLAYFRKCCNWYATRDDEFNSPIVPGMMQSDSTARDRVLSDEELRDIWAALDGLQKAPACYPRYVKTLLLTATRRCEAADMHSNEVDGETWVIPGARYKRLPKHKGYDHVVQLSPAAIALIGDKPKGIKRNSWFVFSTTDGEKAFSGFSKAKRELDKAIAATRERDSRPVMPEWRLHDLRRTARTLMSRAGVSPDHAERCLGHVIGGVRGVYDRHEFAKEKRQAFEALAALVDRILNPTAADMSAAERAA